MQARIAAVVVVPVGDHQRAGLAVEDRGKPALVAWTEEILVQRQRYRGDTVVVGDRVVLPEVAPLGEADGGYGLERVAVLQVDVHEPAGSWASS